MRHESMRSGPYEGPMRTLWGDEGIHQKSNRWGSWTKDNERHFHLKCVTAPESVSCCVDINDTSVSAGLFGIIKHTNYIIPLGMFKTSIWLSNQMHTVQYRCQHQQNIEEYQFKARHTKWLVKWTRLQAPILEAIVPSWPLHPSQILLHPTVLLANGNNSPSC